MAQMLWDGVTLQNEDEESLAKHKGPTKTKAPDTLILIRLKTF